MFPVSLGTYNGPERKQTQCLMKILGRQTKNIMVFSELANDWKVWIWPKCESSLSSIQRNLEASLSFYQTPKSITNIRRMKGKKTPGVHENEKWQHEQNRNYTHHKKCQKPGTTSSNLNVTLFYSIWQSDFKNFTKDRTNKIWNTKDVKLITIAINL